MTLSQHKFLLRAPGKLGISRLPKIADLPPEEKLLFLLLSGKLDERAAEMRLLVMATNWTRFIEIAASNGFAGLVWERLSQQGTGAQPIFLNENGGQRVLDEIRRLSISEMRHAASFDRSFQSLSKLIGGDSDSVLLCKGAVLRYTAYERSEYRLCNDFDCIPRLDAIVPLVERLHSHGFYLIKGDASFCNQFGVGPASSLRDLLCAPAEGIVPINALSFMHDVYPPVDVRLSAFECGLALIEEERFWANAVFTDLGGNRFLVPDQLDQLMICAMNFVKDGLQSWKGLFDVHLLCTAFEDFQWQELVRRCRVEGVATDVWICLTQSVEMFSTEIPLDVLSSLEPRTRLSLRKTFHFTLSHGFSWNVNSLPVLLLNAVSADDPSRRLCILWRCMRPTDSFIRQYYCCHNWLVQKFPFLGWILHYVVLWLPAILTRRVLGHWLWTTDMHYADMFPID